MPNSTDPAPAAAAAAAAASPAPSSSIVVQPTMSSKYNERSSFQRKLNMVARPHLCIAMATLGKQVVSSSSSSSALPPRLAVADFGCSEGANAVEQMAAAVASAFDAFEEAKPRSSPPLSITVTHSDLTNNGWNAVAGAIAAAGDRYAKPPSRVVLMQPSDSGFYQRCFADASLDLVHGAITFHWASRGLRKAEDDEGNAYQSLPSKLEDACILPGLSPDEGVRARAAEAASGDWARILSLRAEELRPGGFLVAALICTERGDTICDLWTVLAGCLRELVEEGRVTSEEASLVVVPVHLRMPDDHRAALRDERIAKLFRVVVDEFETVQATERDAFLEQHRDAERYGTEVAAFFEAVSRTMVEAALAPRLGKEKATELADELYFEKFASKVAGTTPEFAIGLQTLVLEKL